MTHNLQVLGFGAMAVDDIIYVDRPLNAGKGRVTNRITDHGGNVATALVAVATLGGRAGFIGWLSDQPLNDLSARELERHGVDISFAPRRPDARAIRSVITVGPDGERFIAYDDDVPHGTSDTLADDTLAQAQVLMIDGYATHAHAVVARARKLGLAVVADIEWTIGVATETLMGLSDHLVLPYGFALAYTGECNAAAILCKLWSDDRAAVVLTNGDQGAYIRQRGDAVLWHIPGYKGHHRRRGLLSRRLCLCAIRGEVSRRLRPLRNRCRRNFSDGGGWPHGPARSQRVSLKDGAGRCACAHPDCAA